MPLYLDIMRAGVRYLKVAGTCPLFSSSRALRYAPQPFAVTKNKKIGWGLYQTMTLSGITTAAADVVAPSKSKPTITNAATDSDNPLLRSWSDQPFNLPPFKDIRTENFVPAFEVAMAAHIADLEAIASSPLDDFDSVLGAYDYAGALLSRVSSVFGSYTSSMNTPDMQAVQTVMAPVLSRHTSKAYDVPGLFEKIERVNESRDEKMNSGEWTAEQARFAERVCL
jgi:hypothetical protein